MTISMGYVTQMFPSLTMTFVYREVRALRANGLDIQTFSTWKPKTGELSEEARDLVKDTFYVFPLNWPQFLLSHGQYLFTQPLRYLSTLWFCLTREQRTLQHRVRTFFHFCEAVPIAREVERRNIKHLHVHFARNATTMAMVASRLTGVSFSFTAHAKDIFVDPILLPEKIKAARFIIAISEYNARFLHSIVPGQDTLEKIHLVRYGVDVEEFSSPGYQPHNDRPLILGVGRLVEKKGFPYLIKACKSLLDQGYDYQCLIIGGGSQEPLLKEMIDEYGLSDTVHLVGVVFQEHLKDYLSKADIFALPCIVASDQDRDGLPNTLIEAMAMEIPTISTTVSGIPELIEDMKTGLLVPPQDDVALTKAITTLLDDKNLRITLGKAGRAKVVEEFKTEKNANALLDIFKYYLEDEGSQQSRLVQERQKVLIKKINSSRKSREFKNMPKNIEWPTENIIEQIHQTKYVIITPVRNEAQFMEQTLKAVTGQTVKPSEWIIVDDGSTDGTPEIVSRYAAVHPWLKLVNRNARDDSQGDRQRGKGVIDVFYFGYDRLTTQEYEFIIKLDGDVYFEPNYFEFLLGKFASNPKLGLAGGGLYERPDGKNWTLGSSRDHVGGPAKMYRRDCFDAMGGLVPALGWDGLDEWKALTLGWEVRSFSELKILHYRVMGNATGPLKSKIEQGYGAHYMGYHPLYQIARGIRHIFHWPFLVGGMAMIIAYFAAWLQDREQVSDPAVIRYVRHTQLKQLAGLLRGKRLYKS